MNIYFFHNKIPNTLDHMHSNITEHSTSHNEKKNLEISM